MIMDVNCVNRFCNEITSLLRKEEEVLAAAVVQRLI